MTSEPAIAAVLKRAAAVYRKTWWPKHRDGNRAWLTSMQDPLARYGRQRLSYVTRVYQEPWMAGGFPVQVSAWSNCAGAYSTSDSLLVVSSANRGNRGLHGLEITLHEAMHQWDEEIDARMLTIAKANNVKFNDLLSHAMIFYTTGEAMKTVGRARAVCGGGGNLEGTIRRIQAGTRRVLEAVPGGEDDAGRGLVGSATVAGFPVMSQHGYVMAKPVTSVSSREFNQDTGRAKRAARRWPVIFTDRGRPSHVLLTFDEYNRLASNGLNVIGLLGVPGGIEDVELENPGLQDHATPAGLR